MSEGGNIQHCGSLRGASRAYRCRMAPVKTLAVIPARGGSKGLPGKNARLFLGESLLGRAIRIGQETCDAVVVSTDSLELATIAATYAATVHMRPPELATDEAPMLPVVQDAIRGREGDVIVLLQPTQPLRTAEQVRQAIDIVATTKAESVVSVCRVPTAYAPDLLLHLYGDDRRLSWVTQNGPVCSRRQEARPAYVRDGTVYAVRRHVVEARGVYEGALYGIDARAIVLKGDALSIDTMEDFERLEALARRSDGEATPQAAPAPGLLRP